jgi:hypothetical protein
VIFEESAVTFLGGGRRIRDSLILGEKKHSTGLFNPMFCENGIRLADSAITLSSHLRFDL